MIIMKYLATTHMIDSAALWEESSEAATDGGLEVVAIVGSN